MSKRFGIIVKKTPNFASNQLPRNLEAPQGPVRQGRSPGVHQPPGDREQHGPCAWQRGHHHRIRPTL